MGRPKGSSNKSKIEALPEVNENTLETLVQKSPQQELNPQDKAYSIVFDPKTNKYAAVELVFDYQTGTLGNIRVIEQNVSRNIISERLQVLVALNLL